jgi:hypothetical protein
MAEFYPSTWTGGLISIEHSLTASTGGTVSTQLGSITSFVAYRSALA